MLPLSSFSAAISESTQIQKISTYSPETKESGEAPRSPTQFVSTDGQSQFVHIIKKNSIRPQNEGVKSIFALSTTAFPKDFKLPNSPSELVEDELPNNILIGTELRGGDKKFSVKIDFFKTKEANIDLRIKSVLLAAFFEEHLDVLVGDGDISITVPGIESLVYKNFGFMPSNQNLRNKSTNAFLSEKMILPKMSKGSSRIREIWSTIVFKKKIAHRSLLELQVQGL